MLPIARPDTFIGAASCVEDTLIAVHVPYSEELEHVRAQEGNASLRAILAGAFLCRSEWQRLAANPPHPLTCEEGLSALLRHPEKPDSDCTLQWSLESVCAIQQCGKEDGSAFMGALILDVPHILDQPVPVAVAIDEEMTIVLHVLNAKPEAFIQTILEGAQSQTDSFANEYSTPEVLQERTQYAKALSALADEENDLTRNAKDRALFVNDASAMLIWLRAPRTHYEVRKVALAMQQANMRDINKGIDEKRQEEIIHNISQSMNNLMDAIVQKRQGLLSCDRPPVRAIIYPTNMTLSVPRPSPDQSQSAANEYMRLASNAPEAYTGQYGHFETYGHLLTMMVVRLMMHVLVIVPIPLDDFDVHALSTHPRHLERWALPYAQEPIEEDGMSPAVLNTDIMDAMMKNCPRWAKDIFKAISTSVFFKHNTLCKTGPLQHQDVVDMHQAHGDDPLECWWERKSVHAWQRVYPSTHSSTSPSTSSIRTEPVSAQSKAISLIENARREMERAQTFLTTGKKRRREEAGLETNGELKQISLWLSASLLNGALHRANQERLRRRRLARMILEKMTSVPKRQIAEAREKMLEAFRDVLFGCSGLLMPNIQHPPSDRYSMYFDMACKAIQRIRVAERDDSQKQIRPWTRQSANAAPEIEDMRQQLMSTLNALS